MANRVWVNRSYRIFGWAWLAMSAGLGLALVFTPGMKWWGAVLVGLLFGAIGAIGWAVYGATSLSVQGGHVVVRNPFRVIEIPVAAIRKIEPGQRLSLHLQSGGIVRVWSVQAANASLLLNRRSTVDQVAAEVREALSATPGVSPAPEIVERSSLSRPLAFAVVVAAVLSGILRLMIS